jgi:hypothetical protein
MDPDPDSDPDPSIFIIDLQDTTNNELKKFFCIVLFEGTFTSFSKIKVKKKSQNCRHQGLFNYFCLVIEGPGSGSIPLTNESGSMRTKNMWIRIRNTAKY